MITLVTMPFGPVMSPSIALGLLKATLVRHGFECHTQYFTIDFAERLGADDYIALSEGGAPPLGTLAGEWIFSDALFGADHDADVYLRLSRTMSPVPDASWAKTVETVQRARDLVEPFLEHCVEKVLADRPRIVGFTSIFQQQLASLALAKRLKERDPNLFIVFGGANLEGVMGAETVRQFSFVDAAVSGEAEVVLPQLAARVLKGEIVDGLQGVRTRETIDADFLNGHFGNAIAPVMDELPHPDYGDYFDQFAASPLGDEWQPSIFYETSRGCWWGERQHCTFCGLNGGGMKYRSKTAARALDELVALTTKHPGCDVEVTDNILDLSYFNDFLPALAEKKLGMTLFYETKANLKREQVRLLRNAGVTVIQPGIESLSDAVLKLMRKGVSALQNIQLLKWAMEMGVEARWNILCGFPGEREEDYKDMAELAPLLTHLRPPSVCSVIRLDRFSPNFFDAEKLGFTDLQPLASYAHVYRSVPSEAIRNLAYYFTFRYQDERNPLEYMRPLVDRVKEWQRVHATSSLFYADDGEEITIWDMRPSASDAATLLTPLASALYRACESVADLRHLGDVYRDAGGVGGAAGVEDELRQLLDKGVLIRDGNRYLALAIRGGEYKPADEIVGRIDALMDRVPATWTSGLTNAMPR